MCNQNNIFDRLRDGVELESLTADECRVINDLNATGNEPIILQSDNFDIGEQIEEAIPFTFILHFENDAPVLNVFPDGSPDGTILATAANFAVSSGVTLKWI